MRNQPAIQRWHSFLPEHSGKAIDKTRVLDPPRRIHGRLPKPRPNDFVRIRDQSGHELGTPSSGEFARPLDRPVPESGRAAGEGQLGFAFRQGAFGLFVEHPLQRRLADAEVGGAEAAVEPSHALGAHGLAHAVPGVAVAAALATGARVLLVELEARFHEPDRVGGCAGYYSCRRGGEEVNGGCFLPVEEEVAVDSFAVPVGPEVDRASRHDADEVGAEAFEEGAPAFDFGDLAQDVTCLGDVQPGGAEEGHLVWRWYAACCSAGGELALVEVAL